MGLIEFQTVLGRMLREQNRDDHLRGVSLEDGERQYLSGLGDTDEFRFYASVQRSWCIGRATKAAHLTLSLLPEQERARLVDEWVDSGSGAQSFFWVEADAFLDFIGRRLSERSCELTVCQFERATLRASDGANYFVAPDVAPLRDADCWLCRGSYAALVRFEADPGQMIEKHAGLAQLFSAGLKVIFSPGLPELWREASVEEVDLWDALECPTAVGTLLSRGHAIETLETLLEQGAIEYIAPNAPNH